MQPIQELLNRIKWDSEFSKGMFALGYHDRIAREERVVPFTSIALDPGESSFCVCGDDGVVVRIPLHRVRTVYKDGEPIWRRPLRPGGRRG
jgi:uncharacterized protein (UPF0248 family)